MNKYNWQLTIIGNNKVKNIKSSKSLQGKDQYVLFKNGKQIGNILDYTNLVSTVAELQNCSSCSNDCNICLTFNEFTLNVSLILNLSFTNVILYSAIIQYNSLRDIDDLIDGTELIAETLTIPLDSVNYLFGNEQREVIISGYNLNGLCIIKKLIINAKEILAGITEIDMYSTIESLSTACNNGTISVKAIYLPENSSISVDTETWIVTLINTVTSAENKFIFGIYCDGCLISLYTVSTR